MCLVHKGYIWWEGFGYKHNPLLILMMGAGCQGILWPSAFCRKLAAMGFFVIRFDQRDTGRSFGVCYHKAPYTLVDMAEDVVQLMHENNKKSAHLIGISMGGAIAQLLAARHPASVLSLTLIATTLDFRGVAQVLDGKARKTPLSLPCQSWIDWVQELEAIPKWLFWRWLHKQFEGWRILQGNGTPFDEKYYQRMLRRSIYRQRISSSLYNHRYALLASIDDLLQTKGKITVPTGIFHGERDPLFPQDHAEALACSIPGSCLHLVKAMGHNFSPCFHEEFLQFFATTHKKG